MPSLAKLARTRRGRPPITLVLALALLAAGTMAGLALAKSFTLSTAKNATVTNAVTHASKHETIAVNGHGFAVYWLSGDSKAHPKCTKANGCFGFWPPVTVPSGGKLSKAPGISGKLTTWHRNGITQVVLGGHPLYTFSEDTKKHDANGEDISGFGGTWHVVTAAAGSSQQSTKAPSMPTSSTPASPTPTTTTTMTTPYSWG